MMASVIPFPLKAGRTPYSELEVRYAEMIAELQRAEHRAELAESLLAKTRRDLVRLEDTLTRRQKRRAQPTYWLALMALGFTMFIVGYVTAGIGW